MSRLKTNATAIQTGSPWLELLEPVLDPDDLREEEVDRRDARRSR